MTTSTTRSNSRSQLRLAAILCACSLLPASAPGAQDRTREDGAKERVQKQERTRDELSTLLDHVRKHDSEVVAWIEKTLAEKLPRGSAEKRYALAAEMLRGKGWQEGAAGWQRADDKDETPRTREEYATIAAKIDRAVAAGEITAGAGEEKKIAMRKRMGEARRAPRKVDWEARYEQYLKDNPKVEELVRTGKISKSQVLAGMKAREQESKPAVDEELEGIIARFEGLRPGAGERVRGMLERGEVTREDLVARLRGAGRRAPAQEERAAEQDSGQAKAARDLKKALEEMTVAKKLSDKQSAELYRIVFPEADDEQARYEAFLKDNPDIAKAIAGLKMTKEQVLAGMRARAAEEGPSEEKLLEAAHRELIAEHPELARVAKERLMPRLKQMLAERQVQGATAKLSTEQRTMTFGLYLSNLIESGQVERSDLGLKKVHDISVQEIKRQGAADDAKAERPAERGADERMISREEYAEHAAKIELAVDAGRMTAEEGRAQLLELRRRIGRARPAAREVDWNAKYEEFLKANPRVKAQVGAGKITKEQILAGIKARAKEAKPQDDLEQEYQKLLRENPNVRRAVEGGRATKEQILERLRIGRDRERQARDNEKKDPKDDREAQKRGEDQKDKERRDERGGGDREKRGDGR